MNAPALAKLTEIRAMLEGDPRAALKEKLEPREATRARMKAIAMRQKAKGKVEPREATRERMKAIAARQGKSKSKLKPGEKMVFGKVVKAGA